MQLLNDANGVKVFNAAGGWFFRVTDNEVKFYITRDEKWDGSEIAEHTISRKDFEVLLYGIYPNACLFEGSPQPIADGRYFNGVLIHPTKSIDSHLPTLKVGDFLAVKTNTVPADTLVDIKKKKGSKKDA